MEGERSTLKVIGYVIKFIKRSLLDENQSHDINWTQLDKEFHNIYFKIDDMFHHAMDSSDVLNFINEGIIYLQTFEERMQVTLQNCN